MLYGKLGVIRSWDNIALGFNEFKHALHDGE